MQLGVELSSRQCYGVSLWFGTDVTSTCQCHFQPRVKPNLIQCFTISSVVCVARGELFCGCLRDTWPCAAHQLSACSTMRTLRSVPDQKQCDASQALAQNVETS